MNSESLFPSIKSEINTFGALVIQITLFGLLLFSFCLFFLLPIYGIYKRGIEVMLFPAIICFVISFGILIPSINYYFFKRKLIAREIIINGEGLFYYNAKKEITEKILYSELTTSNENFDIRTVNTTTTGLIPLLEIYIQSENNKTLIRRLDMNLSLHVVKNKYELYAHFLRGISIFRPELKIDPIVFHNYFIDKDSWEINQKGRISWVLILGFIIIFTAVTIWLIFLFSKD
jgi:hypothetical protein